MYNNENIVENICSSLPSVKIFKPDDFDTIDTYSRPKTRKKEPIDW
jgi:hypothetical protein